MWCHFQKEDFSDPQKIALNPVEDKEEKVMGERKESSSNENDNSLASSPQEPIRREIPFGGGNTSGQLHKEIIK